MAQTQTAKTGGGIAPRVFMRHSDAVRILDANPGDRLTVELRVDGLWTVRGLGRGEARWEPWMSALL
jgi:hypothetical protein